MIYREHIESVIHSLRKYANDEPTDLFLLKNHLEQIICDVTVEIDNKVEMGKKYEELHIKK
jgi:chromatin remodeling complex protein RSC6